MTTTPDEVEPVCPKCATPNTGNRPSCRQCQRDLEIFSSSHCVRCKHVPTEGSTYCPRCHWPFDRRGTTGWNPNRNQMTWGPWHPSAPGYANIVVAPPDDTERERIAAARMKIVVDEEYVVNHLCCASSVRVNLCGDLWQGARAGQEYGELEGREWLRNASRNPNDVHLPLAIIQGDRGRIVKDFARRVSWLEGAEPSKADRVDNEPEEPEVTQEPEEPECA